MAAVADAARQQPTTCTRPNIALIPRCAKPYRSVRIGPGMPGRVQLGLGGEDLFAQDVGVTAMVREFPQHL